MKKSICVVLAMVIVLSLCACGGGESGGSSAKGLQVGFGREKIMPKDSVPLGGYGDTKNRMSSGYRDYLYGTCVAFRNGDDTVLLFSQDLPGSRIKCTEMVRKALNEKFGIPAENIQIASTHTHSAPDQSSDHPNTAAYNEGPYLAGMVKAAENAINDLAPAKLYTTRTTATNMSGVRHYEMNDGTYYGSNFGNESSGIKQPATDPDQDMIVVKVDREGDKKDIALINWQSHPCFVSDGGKSTDISADYIGVFRDSFESQTDMHFIFFLGAAGNQGSGSKIKELDNGYDLQDFGAALAKFAIDALPNLKPLEGDAIQVKHVSFTANYNHEEEDRLKEAQDVVDTWKKVSREAGNQKAYALGFSSIYHANAILSRPKRPATGTMELYALSVGEMAFIAAPFEMWTDSSKYIKKNSPYETTIISTLTNNSQGYLGSKEAYEYGSYETDTAHFAKGTAEGIAEQFVTMLKELKG